MKKLTAFIMALTCVLGLAGCSSTKTFEMEDVQKIDLISVDGKKAEISDTDALNELRKEPSVVKTYEVTDSELAEEYWENNELVTMVKYYEMSDGTWKTDDYTYQYRLEVTGRMNNAYKDSTFVFLSNTTDITFEQAWKASGFSSNMDDYFKEEDAKFVAMK